MEFSEPTNKLFKSHLRKIWEVSLCLDFGQCREWIFSWIIMLIKSFVIILACCSCVLALPIVLSKNANTAVQEFERIVEDLEQLFAEGWLV